MQALRYSVEEALASMWRGRQSAVLSTGMIALALFVLGSFLIVTVNLERLGAEWSSAAELSVYLKDEITEEQRQAIERTLQPGEMVEAQEYVSKAAALARFRQTFGDLAGSMDALGNNPLPASFEVRLKSGAGTEAGIDALGAALRQAPGVVDVRYDRQWLSRLLSAISVMRSVGLMVGTALSIAAALTVAAVIRLALQARRDEIEIMQLVGAPDAYVRGPFVIEGLLQGGLGAGIALAALALTFLVARAPYLEPLAAAINLSSVRFLPIELSALLLGSGMVMGCVGGLVAAWGR